VFAYLSPRGPHPRIAARNAGLRVAADQNRPAPQSRTPGGARQPRPACCSTPSISASTAGTTRPDSGSAATTTRRRAAHGACPAARTWTRAQPSHQAVRSSIPSIARTTPEQARRGASTLAHSARLSGHVAPGPSRTSRRQQPGRARPPGGFAHHRIPQSTAGHLTPAAVPQIRFICA